jgi:drug/metabolite transporter (DMT)-like permease
MGVAAAVVATLLWASAAVLGKAIDAPTFVMLAWRELIAVVALVSFAGVRGHRYTPADLRASAPATVLFALHVTVFFTSLQLTSVAIVVLIYALAPMLLMPLAAWQFGERPAPIVWVLALASVGGIALVVGHSDDHGSNPTLGVLVSIGNVLAWVVFTFASKRARSRSVPTLTWLTAANLGALVVATAGALLSGESLGNVHGADWIRIVTLALVPGLIGHGLMIWSYRTIDVSLASVIAVGEPVLGAAAAALFLGESLHALQVVGIVVVCSAVALVVLSSTRRQA